jgi:hypothetical protein
MPVRQRQLILGAAALVVLGLTAWTFWPSSPAPAAPSATPARGRAQPATSGAAGPVAGVKMDALTAERQEPGGEARNPFRFKPKVVAPPPRPAVAPPPAIVEPPRPPAPAGPPAPAPIPLKLIGVVTRETGVKWAVLSDGKNALFHGKDGDMIDGRYLIVKIGIESIEMTYADGRGRQVIRLTGQ